MFYADDTQLYIHFDSNSMAESLKILQHCIDSIKKWMLQNPLMLNDEKTEIIIFRSRNNLETQPSSRHFQPTSKEKNSFIHPLTQSMFAWL